MSINMQTLKRVKGAFISHRFSQARVVEKQIYGKRSGNMLESSKGYESQRHVSLECLNFSLSFYWAEKTDCTRFPFQCVLLSSATYEWLLNS